MYFITYEDTKYYKKNTFKIRWFKKRNKLKSFLRLQGTLFHNFKSSKQFLFFLSISTLIIVDQTWLIALQINSDLNTQLL